MRTWVLLWVVVVLLQPASGVEDGGREREARIAAAAAPPHKGTLRSIQSLDGDILDCVLRHHQPALEHPLLKNHIIQEFPSFTPINDHANGKTQEQSSSYETFQVWQQNEKCPYGTIPILRKDPSHGLAKKHPHQFPRTPSQMSRRSLAEGRFLNHEYAIAAYRPTTNNYIYGASFTSNQWSPIVEQDDEFSLSQMWILAGSYEDSDLNSIEVGWQVSRGIYHDDATHLFIYWTADAYNKTGCYNLQCSGFVQVDNTIVLGGSLGPSSTYEGDQVELPQIVVWKDSQTQNWWLQYGTKFVGYWPKEIYTHLSNYGEIVEWGGEVVNNSPGGSHTSTQMGSGHFASEGYQKACYTRSLAIVDTTNKLYSIPMQDLSLTITNSNCYSIELETYSNWGTSFFFGGPGKNLNCP